MVWAKKTWNKKPKKGTSWDKFSKSKNRVNFKKTNWQKPTFKPNVAKKDDSLDGVWECVPGEKVIYYTPQEWKKREIELNKQTLETLAKQQSVRKAPFKTKAEVL